MARSPLIFVNLVEAGLQPDGGRLFFRLMLT
jgi:hypothetical protein